MTTQDQSSAPPADGLYNELFRPQIHFTSERNWINDPNGMLYADGVFHLFYQHNPFGDKWGHMSWGHAVSDDMLHWRHKPIALMEEDGVMIFSGSAVHDHTNTSGLGDGGKGPLIAIYTAHHTAKPERQTQCIAYSNDGGDSWSKYAGNPVIDIDAEHFRDPKVFWHEQTGRWVMVVSVATSCYVQFYSSPNLIDWTMESAFGPAGAPDVPNWECPELFELPVDGDPENTRWVLQIDVGGNGVAGGSGSQYFIGRFDGKQFINDNPPELTLWCDYGRDFYAAQAFTGLTQHDGRAVWLAWMNNWDYANDVPTAPFRGAMTLPREITLHETPEGIRVRQVLVREIESLRQDELVLNPLRLSDSSEILDVSLSHEEPVELHATFVNESAARYGLRFNYGDDLKIKISFDSQARTVGMSADASGIDQLHPKPMTTCVAPVQQIDSDRLDLRLLIDRGVFEVFVNDGEATMTNAFYPASRTICVEAFAELGRTRLQSLTGHRLSSVWS